MKILWDSDENMGMIHSPVRIRHPTETMEGDDSIWDGWDRMVVAKEIKGILMSIPVAAE